MMSTTNDLHKKYIHAFMQTIYIDDDILKFIYERVLLVCESDLFDGLEQISVDDEITKKDASGADVLNIICCNTKNNTKKHLEKIGKYWYLEKSLNTNEMNNEIYYVARNLKISKLLIHIRNAFAHNLISMHNDTVIVGDFGTTGPLIDFNKPTMLGRMTTDYFIQLITTINEKRSLQNNNINDVKTK